MPVVIRPATVTDLGAVRDIYNHYVARSTCTFQVEPDTEAERLAWFRNRAAAHPVTVAEAGGAVVGWAALSPWKGRAAYARSAEVSVYVRHDCRRRGVGRALLLDLIARGRAAGLHTLIGGACTEHPASLALQAAVGFERVACFRQVGHKFGRWLDVAYMQRHLDAAELAAPAAALGRAHLRVARPTDDLDAVTRFYRDGLGFEVLAGFRGHDGFDGVMLGHRRAGYHLEFTRAAGHPAGRAPTADNLLVFYLPDAADWRAAVRRLEAAGYPPVPAVNPYWDRQGRTYEDPDGYRVVLQHASWPTAPTADLDPPGR